MAAHAPRLARLFTPYYATIINRQLLHPAPSHLVKPNELQSALAQPLHMSINEPHRTAPHLAAALSHRIIKGIWSRQYRYTTLMAVV
ncbi:hypothetical protein EW146_g554 [Bondarzewia mesenterica]|uniref:Uncharacterized protein n=1 Tax=Bondarzewia mesenterica TaxID=1095465 RepID=A0A4S4M817_9AGAM|nr:hypothetical protein EW146_g554 [Bondarzewia mesenterica]